MTPLDLRALTIDDVAHMTGTIVARPHVGAEDHCDDCGGLLTDAVEVTTSHPFGTGYTIRACEECGCVDWNAGRRWTGF